METLRVTVVHAVAPDRLDEYEIEGELATLAAGRHVLVCRKGGTPSWFERLWSFLRRSPIEAVTLVSDTTANEGQEISVTVEETDLLGVYEVKDFE